MNTVFVFMAMNALTKWFQENGSESRKALLQRIKAKYPRFTQTSLSQYSHNKRVPAREIAEMIAEFTGLALADIPHRYIHKPNGDKSQSEKSVE